MADSGIIHVVSTIPVPQAEFEDEAFHGLVHGNTFPAAPVERQLYYRDDTHKWYVFNGSGWKELTGASTANLTDLADVSVAAPADDDFFYYDDATGLWKSKAHADLTTGVHGVGAHYLAYTKSSQKEALFHNNHMARAFLASTQHNIPSGGYHRVELDTVTAPGHDPGGNFQTGVWVSGTAGATTPDHLIGAGFVATMLGARVYNTTDTTYASITAVNSATDLTLSADIFVLGEGYQINHADYKVPVSGYYTLAANAAWSAIVADKRYYTYIQNNAQTISQCCYHAAANGLNYLYGMGADIQHLSAGDLITLAVAHPSGVDTLDVLGHASGTYSYLSIALLQAD